MSDPHFRRTVTAPAPSSAAGTCQPNRVLSVDLEADEDVEWLTTTTADGMTYVSGYTIVKRQNAAASRGWSPNYRQDVSPSPNAGWMVKQFAESAPKPVRFYMAVGSWESARMLSGNRILHSVLIGKGNEVIYREAVVGHNYANFQQTLPDGLIALLGDKRSHR